MCSATGSATATATVRLENDRVKVTEWRFAHKGDTTGWHRHGYDYVIVPMFDGVLLIDLPGGERVEAQLQTGIPYFRQCGVEHNVTSGNDFDCAFIEIELLEKPIAPDA